MPKYRTILVDPPWPSKGLGYMKGRSKDNSMFSPTGTEYPVISMERILAMPVEKFAGKDCHLWLWATNSFLHQAFHVMEAWGFKFLYDIVACKPSGCGAYFAVTTQHLLMGCHKKCFFHKARWRKTCFDYVPKRSAQKPEISYELIESISMEPRLELFARQKREGWDSWGNEVECDVEMVV